MSLYCLILIFLIVRAQEIDLENASREELGRYFMTKVSQHFQGTTTTATSQPERHAYRSLQIIKAERVARPLEGRAGNLLTRVTGINHVGIRVYTENNQIYLLHAVPYYGTVATKVPMSLKWKTIQELTIVGTKTIGDTLRSSGYGPYLANYVSGGTCIGTANKMQKYLETEEEPPWWEELPDDMYWGLQELEHLA